MHCTALIGPKTSLNTPLPLYTLYLECWFDEGYAITAQNMWKGYYLQVPRVPLVNGPFFMQATDYGRQPLVKDFCIGVAMNWS